MKLDVATPVLVDRVARTRAQMEAEGVDVLLLSTGPDLPYLTAYAAMPLERLTMFVLPRDGEATLVVPRLEAPRVVERPEVFSIVPWGETEDPIDVVAHLAKGAGVAAIGDHTWARFLVDLLASMPSTTFRRGASVMSPLRSRKDDAEIDALRAAGAAADRVAAQLQSGAIPLVGRTQAQVSIDISQRLIDEGHQKVNFAIVAAGENAASPHHHASERVIRAGEVVLCDFGGTMNGYCSDITRCVSLGDPPAEVADAYAVLHEAQQAAVRAAVVGTSCEEIDATARRIIATAGWGGSSSIAPATASGWRSTRTPTSWRATPWRWPGPRLQHQAGHLRRRPLGHAAGGHPRRRRRRARGHEPCRSRPGGRRRLTAEPACRGLDWPGKSGGLISPGGRRRTGRGRPGACEHDVEGGGVPSGDGPERGGAVGLGPRCRRAPGRTMP